MRKKLTFILLAIALIPVLILSFYTYNSLHKTLNEQAMTYSNGVFTQSVEEIDSTINTLSEITNVFSSYSSGNASLVRSLRQFSDENNTLDSLTIYNTRQSLNVICQSLFNTYGFLNGIYIFTPSGVTFSFDSTRQVKLQYNYKPTDEYWYEEIQDNFSQIYLSPVAMHEDIFDTEHESVFIAKQLYDVYTSTCLGYILIDCDPDIINLDTINTLPDMISIVLCDTLNNEIIYSSGEFDSDFDLEEYIENSTYNAGTSLENLEVYVTTNNQALFENYNSSLIVLIIVIAVCIIFIILASAVVANLVSKPINHLAHEMSEQSDTNLTTSTQYLNRTDEIGVLYKEYNHMVEALNEEINTNYKNRILSMEAQMKALEARINMHFLFNTLEAINSVALIEGSPRASQMAISLANMFRYIIKTPSEIVSVQDELNNVNDYISIQSIRFSDNFTFQVIVPDELLDKKVLKLILQPLVENSFQHGLQNGYEGNKIYIYAACDEESISFYIIDNGIGMSKERLIQIQESLEGDDSIPDSSEAHIGLKNINSRIELYYGEGYGLTIKSRENTGTMVCVKVPFITEEKENEL